MDHSKDIRLSYPEIPCGSNRRREVVGWHIIECDRAIAVYCSRLRDPESGAAGFSTEIEL